MRAVVDALGNGLAQLRRLADRRRHQVFLGLGRRIEILPELRVRYVAQLDGDAQTRCLQMLLQHLTDLLAVVHLIEGLTLFEMLCAIEQEVGDPL
ncbi:hypothetical protein D3C86_1823560 [compost metagenome]